MRRGRIYERQQACELASARHALEQERDILQAVMDGAKNSHLVYLDRDFNFVRVNETYAHTCHYRPEEMIGKNHFALYPHAENEAIFRRVRDTGESFAVHDKPFEFPDQPQRGITYWDWTLIPVKNAANQVIGLIFSLFETTQRVHIEQALRRSEARWNAATESFTDGVIIATEAEQVIYWNPAARKMHGFVSATEGIGPLDDTPETFQLWTADGRRMLELDEWPMRPRGRKRRGASGAAGSGGSWVIGGMWGNPSRPSGEMAHGAHEKAAGA
jgi:PAS domain S-box-containing protein